MLSLYRLFVWRLKIKIKKVTPRVFIYIFLFWFIFCKPDTAHDMSKVPLEWNEQGQFCTTCLWLHSYQTCINRTQMYKIRCVAIWLFQKLLGTSKSVHARKDFDFDFDLPGILNILYLYPKITFTESKSDSITSNDYLIYHIRLPLFHILH